MSKFTGRRTGKLTPEQERAMQQTQQWVDENRPQLDREALRHKAELDARIEAFRLLKAERERRGLSLSDVAVQSGIDKSYLSRLENDAYPNPTLATLMRYAQALGGRIELTFRGAA